MEAREVQSEHELEEILELQRANLAATWAPSPPFRGITLGAATF